MPDFVVESARLLASRGSFAYAPARRSITKSDAIVISALSRPGDEGLPLALMVGVRGSSPAYFSYLPPDDPFLAESSAVEFFCRVAETLVPLLSPRDDSYWPQIVVGSPSDIRHVQAIAVRASGIGDVARGMTPSDDIVFARHFGTLLGVSTCMRFGVVGQQQILSATGLLSDHFATALSDTERSHLLAHAYCAMVDRGPHGPVVAREKLSLQSSHRPLPEADAILGLAVADSSFLILDTYARPVLEGVHRLICDVMNFLEGEISTACGHLSEIEEIESRQFSYLSRAAMTRRAEGRDLRWRLLGGTRNEGQRVLEFADSEHSGRRYRDLCFRHDPVVRAKSRCSESRDSSWGVVLDSRDRGVRVLLSEQSGDPDSEKELVMLVGGSPEGGSIRVVSLDDFPEGRIASCEFVRPSPCPPAGEIVDLYCSEVTPYHRYFVNTAKRRFAVSPWARSDGSLESDAVPVPLSDRINRRGLAASLREYKP